MPVERSAGIIIFRNTPEGRKYLILRSSKHLPKRGEFWDIPKGRLEKGESGLEAARREAREEAGLGDFEIIPEFKETVRYFTWREGKRAIKFVAVFLAKTQSEEIKLSWEHDTYAWLPFKEAQAKLLVKEIKEVIEKAHDFLQAKGV